MKPAAERLKAPRGKYTGQSNGDKKIKKKGAITRNGGKMSGAKPFTF